MILADKPILDRDRLRRIFEAVQYWETHGRWRRGGKVSEADVKLLVDAIKVLEQCLRGGLAVLEIPLKELP